MRFLIIVLLFSQLLSQDIGKKMIDNGDFDSALNYYKYLLDNEKLSKDDHNLLSQKFGHQNILI